MTLTAAGLSFVWKGLYVPIIVLSATAAWLLLVRLVVPAIRERQFDLERLSFGLGALFAMASHTEENIVFGLGRWFLPLRHLLTDLHWAVIGKLMIIAGAVLTLGALTRAQTTRAHLGGLTVLALLLWALGSVLAVWLADAPAL